MHDLNKLLNTSVYVYDLINYLIFILNDSRPPEISISYLHAIRINFHNYPISITVYDNTLTIEYDTRGSCGFYKISNIKYRSVSMIERIKERREHFND